MIVRSRLQGLGVFAPILFVPLVLIGFLVDIFVLETLLFSLVTAGIGLLFILFGFIVTLLNIPVEKKAMERAQVILENELTGEEMVTVKKIFRSYLVEYVLQFFDQYSEKINYLVYEVEEQKIAINFNSQIYKYILLKNSLNFVRMLL